MFKLTLQDRNGTALNIGDIVKISNGKDFTFFAEVKYFPEEKLITPFHTFSFHSFEKVDAVPEHAIECTEPRYKIWFTHSPEADTEAAKERAENYLIEWRKCEKYIGQRMFLIELL